MDDLCRICLTVSGEIMLKFSDDNIFLQKIQACLPVTIVVNESLPNQICKLCVEKVEEINEFYKKVKENDCLLNEYLKNGTDLESFYSKLKNKITVKKQFEAVFVDNDDNSVINQEFDDDSDDNSVISPDFDDDNVKENMKKIENINNQITDIDNLSNNSEDEISLLVIQRDVESKAEKTHSKVNDDYSKLKHNPFKCLMCSEILDSQINLYKHYNKEHYNNTKMPEGECLTVYSDSGVVYRCSICDKEFSTKKSTILHLVAHTDKKQFSCNLCGRTYKTIQQIIQHGKMHSGIKLHCKFGCGHSTAYPGILRLHYRRHHKHVENVKHPCDVCGKKYTDPERLKRHKNFIHLGIKPYTCSVCNKAFRKLSGLQIHERTHTGERNYMCDYCGKRYTQQSALNRHHRRYLSHKDTNVRRKSARAKKYICAHCSLRCDTKKLLIDHLKEHGFVKLKRSYLCDICGKTYPNSEYLKRHEKFAHKGVKPHTCSFCNKAFRKKSYLLDHEPTHTGEKNYACGCGKRFAQQSGLNKHYHRDHTGPNAFECAKCKLNFKKYLLNHRASVHPESTRVNKYICTHCLLRCDTINSLVNHLKEHGIERPSCFYLCDACGKTYADPEHLNNHKKFACSMTCSVCNKAFRKKSNLEAHERTHTGERDYMCECGRRFTQQSSLNRHYRGEHTGTYAFKCNKCGLSFKNRRLIDTHLITCV